VSDKEKIKPTFFRPFPLQIKKRPPGYIDLVCIYAGIGLLGILIVYLFPWISYLVPPCFFYRITGFPCPSCGMTRSVFSFSRLDIGAAFFYNPLFAICSIGIILTTVFSISLYFFDKRYLHWELKSYHWLSLRWIILSAILTNWLYLILFLPE